MINLLIVIGLFLSPVIIDNPTPEIIPPVTEEPTIELEPTEESTLEVQEPAVSGPVIEVTPEPTEVVTPEPVYEKPTIAGCTDKRAVNYIASDENWNVKEDGSCYYLTGCTDSRAVNYVDFGIYTIDDGSCYYFSGCTDPSAVNYIDFGQYTQDDGSCYYLICDASGSCDVSYSRPAKKKSVVVEAQEAPIVYAQEESIELSYIFDFDNPLFLNIFYGVYYPVEVCRE